MPNVGALALGFLLQSSGFSLIQSMGDQVSEGTEEGYFVRMDWGGKTYAQEFFNLNRYLPIGYLL